MAPSTIARETWVRPPRLEPGDRVRVIAPAGPVPRGPFQTGVAELARLGLVAEWDESLFDRRLIFAGTEERRRVECERAFTDPEAKAVLAARGGGGTVRILPIPALDTLRDRPRAFSGFSDLTILHQAMAARRLVSFYGPMVAWDMARAEGAEGGYDEALFRRLLLDGEPGGRIAPEGVRFVRGGSAEGRLAGGCLSLLSACVGTPEAPSFEDAIVVLEDENEFPHRVDRFLHHLRRAGTFRGARAVVLGDFPGCEPRPGTDMTVRDVFEDFFADFDGPVAWGYPIGHTSRANLTIPLGTRARLDDRGGGLDLLEPACR